jgi:hypothetical protein
MQGNSTLFAAAAGEIKINKAGLGHSDRTFIK